MFRHMMQQRVGMICLMVLPWLFCSQAHAGGTFYVPGYYEYFSGKYNSDEKNLALLKELKPQMAQIRIVGFSASDPSNHYLVCRGSYPVSPPGDIAYHAFLAEALRADLVEAGMYSEENGVAIKGYLKDISFSSFMKGEWTIEASFSVEGKDSMTVKKTFEFSPAAGAVEACSRTSNAMVPAIQAFLQSLYSDPKFKELVGGPTVNNVPSTDTPELQAPVSKVL